MKKKTLLFILLDLVFLAVFNALFFIIGGTQHKTSVWLCYGFIHLAYLLLVLTPVLCGKERKSAVLHLAVEAVSEVYFLITLIIGLVFIFIAPDSIKVPLLIQILVTGFYLILLLVNLIANTDSGEKVSRQKSETAYIKDSAARLKLLIDKLPERRANKAIERAYDTLRSSPTRSDDSVFSLEQSIADQISYLESAVKLGDSKKAETIAHDIAELVNERNSILKQRN